MSLGRYPTAMLLHNHEHTHTYTHTHTHTHTHRPAENSPWQTLCFLPCGWQKLQRAAGLVVDSGAIRAPASLQLNEIRSSFISSDPLLIADPSPAVSSRAADGFSTGRINDRYLLLLPVALSSSTSPSSVSAPFCPSTPPSVPSLLLMVSPLTPPDGCVGNYRFIYGPWPHTMRNK